MKINAEQLGKLEVSQPLHRYFDAQWLIHTEGKLKERRQRTVVHNLTILTLLKPIMNSFNNDL